MILQKWDYKLHEYLPFEVPDERRIILYTMNMDEIIDCTNCGVEMDFGSGYTSLTIHNAYGLGYPVCQDCYDDEVKEKDEVRRATNDLSY